ncbi:MAG TPA: NAD-dependent epimerase/dehydratase family protein [Acidimicrobiales bacterium]|nr:NAD-dependent epimerase/dehydratase family protein [Acidimicrobiales bacterium]
MRVLVLGGNRYIGLSLVRQLAAAGHEVTVANSHEAELPEGVARIHVDRRIGGALPAAVRGLVGSVDAVFDNTAYEVADLEELVDLFDGAVAHYVFTSSVAVYRRSFVQPITEHARLHDTVDDQPLRAYGVNKARCERFLFDRFASTGFPATSVRVGHTIGPRSPLPTRDPGFFARLEQGRPVLVPGDGFPFVHLVHVDDAAGLLVALLGNPLVAGEAYNAAGPEFASILGTVHLFARAAGVEPHVVHVPLDVLRGWGKPVGHWHEGTAGGTVISIAKALAHLDWRPRFGLAAACTDSWAWYDAGGRDLYEFDFTDDDRLLAELGRQA